ncbi:hypothetical protein N0V85_002380 [Neurospora sp. IMI 360204]|nr:hypothetical protein N0V85_002380 [Neurospora sp. IMI 360204]
MDYWNTSLTMSTEPSQPLTTQNNGDEHQVPIILELELIDVVYSPITLISDLPKKHLPSITSPSPLSKPFSDVTNRKRLVFIGDTHGRLTTLRSLLVKISFDNTTDHLILAGDLVTKGPDSKGLVQFARDIGASAVRGNHDDKVLEAAKWLSRIKQGKKWRGKAENEADSVSDDEEEVSEKEEEANDTLDVAGRRRRNKKPKGVKPEHIAVARSLSPSQLHWLASRPIILRVGHLSGAKTAPWNAKEVVVVHGGLIPSLPLEKQDPWAVMNMRSLAYELATSSAPDNTRNEDEKKNDGNINTTHKRITTIPLDTREGEPWSRAWNRYQNLISNASKRVAVVYGHDARSGLQVDKDITINLGKSPIPISARQITGTGDQTANVSAGGDVEIEIETKVEIESESDGGNGVEAERRKKKPKKFKGTRYAYGLDSGCGHGKQLSALVLEINESGDDIVHRIEQVECE